MRAQLRVLLNPLARMGRLENERPVGILPSLLEELARRLGCPMHIEVVPRARLFDMFQGGQGDLIVAGRNRGTAAFGDFVPLVKLRPSIVFERSLAASVPADTQALLQRADWRGLYVRASAMSDSALDLWQQLETQRRATAVRDWNTVLRMLLAGRAEFTLFMPTLLYGETEHMGAEARQRLLARPLGGLPPYEIGLLLSSRLPLPLRERLTRQIERIARDGTLRRMLVRDYPVELVDQDFVFLS